MGEHVTPEELMAEADWGDADCRVCNIIKRAAATIEDLQERAVPEGWEFPHGGRYGRVLVSVAKHPMSGTRMMEVSRNSGGYWIACAADHRGIPLERGRFHETWQAAIAAANAANAAAEEADDV